MATKDLHQPVLLHEAIEALRIAPDGTYIDATFGRGGHSEAILDCLGPQGRLIALDQDPTAIAAAERFSNDPRFEIVSCSFTDVVQVATERGLAGNIKGILFDLGVSSPQLDEAERGFSFQQDGPLDMRMDPRRGQSAKAILATIKEDELAKVLATYGEERYARRIARAICEARLATPLERTKQLADLIASAMPSKEKHKHPATRSFQALRILVNDELNALEQVLSSAYEVLAPGGRLAAITFHSLEDRIVKSFFRSMAQYDPYPKDLPITADLVASKMRIVVRKKLPSAEEVANNPRARSAKLRVAEKQE